MPRRPSTLHSVDVVVVTYNPGPTLEAFLDSVPAAGGVASVTVVDSASPEQTAGAVAKARGLRFIQGRTNRGYGAAVNLGAREGHAPWIAACNADIMLSPGALSALLAGAEGDDRIGAVGPRILESDGSVYPSARPLPSIGLGAGHAGLGRIWPRNPWTRRYRVEHDPAAGPRDAGWLSGSCLVIKREVFEELGGFDEGFFMFMEDVDLGRRLGLAGYRCRWIPDAVITHLGGHSWRRDPAPMIRAHHASAARYVGLAYPRWWRAPLRAVLRLGLKARTRTEVAAARRGTAD